MGDIIDLGNLARPRNTDEHLAGIVMIAIANRDAYTDVKDDDDIEEAFVFGYTRALAAFVSLTTGGLVDIPQDVLLRTAYAAYVDHRGMLWVSALASLSTPPEEGAPLMFDPELATAYLSARGASDIAEANLSVIRGNIEQILARHQENEQAKTAIMLDPSRIRRGF